MRRIYLFALAWFACLNQTYANAICKETLDSYQDIIACAEAKSPDVQSSKIEVERAATQIQVAGQWRNPDLSAETFQGRFGSESRSETDFSLSVPIELGGKISARTDVARRLVSVAEARLLETRAKVRSEVFLKLHRLRQVLHEQEIIDEAISTFSKLITQYSNRPTLSPEQRVSLSVYQLSRSDYDLKRSETVDEILALDAYFKFKVGLPIEQFKKILPESPKSWVSLKTENSKGLSPQRRIFEAELAAANAELSLARSEAWSTLSIGPSLKMLKEGGQSDSIFGLNIGFQLPLFNTNAGGKASASAGLRLAEARQNLGLREQDLRREQLLKTYEQSVRTLSTSLSHREIEKRHSDAERLFTRGIVPSALVIEAHRTSLDLEKTRHARELKALESLLDIHTIEGTILEVNL